MPGTENADSLFWSPDGRFVGFFAATKLWRVDLSGGVPVPICDVNANQSVRRDLGGRRTDPVRPAARGRDLSCLDLRRNSGCNRETGPRPPRSHGRVALVSSRTARASSTFFARRTTPAP